MCERRHAEAPPTETVNTEGATDAKEGAGAELRAEEERKLEGPEGGWEWERLGEIEEQEEERERERERERGR